MNYCMTESTLRVFYQSQRKSTVLEGARLYWMLLCINKIINAQKHTCEDQRADKVMFVITTDGMENACREYNYSKIKQMVEHQKEKYGWDFIFLGANIDAVSTAARFGISKDRAANYHADSEGTLLNYEVMCEAISELRASRPISASWKSRVDEDYMNHSTKKNR